MKLNFLFESYDHLRYENGTHTSGPHGSARRGIKVEPGFNSNELYIVSIYNFEENYLIGNNTIQMTPKQMRLFQQSNEKVILRGFGYDLLGEDFSNYGLTILLSDNIIEKCILHMYDRNVNIEYLANKQQSIDNLDEFEEILLFTRKLQSLTRDEKIVLALRTDNLVNTGVDYYEAGDTISAIEYYNKALEIFPINDDALKNLIICFEETLNFEKMYQSKRKLNFLRLLGI